MKQGYGRDCTRKRKLRYERGNSFSKAKLKQDKVWKWENALSRLLSQRKTKANRLESDRSTKKVKIRDENSNSDVEMQSQAHEVVMQEQNQETGATGHATF